MMLPLIAMGLKQKILSQFSELWNVFVSLLFDCGLRLDNLEDKENRLSADLRSTSEVKLPEVRQPQYISIRDINTQEYNWDLYV